MAKTIWGTSITIKIYKNHLKDNILINKFHFKEKETPTLKSVKLEVLSNLIHEFNLIQYQESISCSFFTYLYSC